MTTLFMAVKELEIAVAGFRREWRIFKIVTLAALVVFFCVVAAFAQSRTSVMFSQLFTGQSSTGPIEGVRGCAQSGDHEPRRAVERQRLSDDLHAANREERGRGFLEHGVNRDLHGQRIEDAAG